MIYNIKWSLLAYACLSALRPYYYALMCAHFGLGWAGPDIQIRLFWTSTHSCELWCVDTVLWLSVLWICVYIALELGQWPSCLVTLCTHKIPDLRDCIADWITRGFCSWIWYCTWRTAPPFYSNQLCMYTMYWLLVATDLYCHFIIRGHFRCDMDCITYIHT